MRGECWRDLTAILPVWRRSTLAQTACLILVRLDTIRNNEATYRGALHCHSDSRTLALRLVCLPSVMSSTSPLSPKHCAKRQPPDGSPSRSMMAGVTDDGKGKKLYGERHEECCEPSVRSEASKGEVKGLNDLWSFRTPMPQREELP